MCPLYAREMLHAIEYDEMLEVFAITIKIIYHIGPEIRLYFSDKRDVRFDVIVKTHFEGKIILILRGAIRWQIMKELLRCQIQVLIEHRRSSSWLIVWVLLFRMINGWLTLNKLLIRDWQIHKSEYYTKRYMKDKPVHRGFKYWWRNDAKLEHLFQFGVYAR